MDITIPQKKKHLLLLNRLMRTELKKDIIPVPSKLTEEEVNKFFERLFVKKTDGEDEYYVPMKSKVELKIDEELFKGLIKKPKVKGLQTEEKIKAQADNFIKSLINPYLRALKAGNDGMKEKKEMINKYVKLKFNVKQNIKKRWAKLYETILNPADVERTARKEKLIEEEGKKKSFKQEFKMEKKKLEQEAKEEKKTEPENELKEEPKKKLSYLQDIEYKKLKDLNEVRKIGENDIMYIPLEQLNEILKTPSIWYDLETPIRRKINDVIQDHRFLRDKLYIIELDKKKKEEEMKRKEKEVNKSEIELLDKKELVKEIIKQPEEIIKKGDFEYDSNYFNSFEMIEKSDRGVRRDEEKLKIKIMLERLQFQYDLYTTPKECIDTIFNNILNDKELHKEKINILEPSAGTGRFIRYIIDNKAKLKINDLDAIEYSSELYDLLKDKVKIDNIYNNDFLYFNKDKKYDLIVMNPPYRGSVNGINEPEYYKYHLIKAILLNKNKKIIYLISPNLSGSSVENMGSINLVLNNALLKRVNKFFKFDFENDMPNYEINKIGECNGFIKFTKAGTTKMQQSFNIYKILVN